MDEAFLTMNGERYYLWRAVDQDGNVLDILVQRRRHKAAAKKFFRKLLKGLTSIPRVSWLFTYSPSRSPSMVGAAGREPVASTALLKCSSRPSTATVFGLVKQV